MNWECKCHVPDFHYFYRFTRPPYLIFIFSFLNEIVFFVCFFFVFFFVLNPGPVALIDWQFVIGTISNRIACQVAGTTILVGWPVPATRDCTHPIVRADTTSRSNRLSSHFHSISFRFNCHLSKQLLQQSLHFSMIYIYWPGIDW